MAIKTNLQGLGNAYQASRGNSTVVEDYEPRSTTAPSGWLDDTPLAVSTSTADAVFFGQVAEKTMVEVKNNPSWKGFKVGTASIPQSNGLAFDTQVFWLRTEPSATPIFYAIGLMSTNPENVWINKIQVQGGEVDLLETASLVVDSVMKSTINDFLINTGAFPQGAISAYAGYCLVPQEFTMSENHTKACDLLVKNAYNACLAKALELSSSRNASTTQITNLRIEVSNDNSPRVDEVEIPIHSTAAISFTQVKDDPAQTRRSRNYREGEATVAKLVGYMDPIYYSPAARLDNHRPSRPDIMPQWAHNFVVKQITSNQGVSLMTTLMGLFSVAALEDRNMYKYMYRGNAPKMGNQEIDYRNIGALGFINPGLGTVVDTSSANFTDEVYIEYINDIFSPVLSVTLDLPYTSPSAWRVNPFSVLANQGLMGKEPVEARKVLVDHIERYLGRTFREVLGNAPIFDNIYEVYNGTFVDRNGMRRDIDSVMNTIAFANYLTAVGDVKMVEKFNAYLDIYGNPRVDQVNRSKLYQMLADDITGHKVSWHGQSLRCTLSDQFMYALAESVRDMKMVFDVKSSFIITEDNSAGRSASYYDQRLANNRGRLMDTRAGRSRGAYQRDLAMLY